MNKTDIIETAFRVWGQELFKTTSLSKIAQALGVTKPALYRHFASKDALLEGMYGYYCDHYVGFIKASYEKAESRDINQGGGGVLLMVRNIAEYCARYKYIFIFFLVEVYGDKNREAGIPEQFAARGLDMKKYRAFRDPEGEYPSRAKLIATAIFFLVARFHKKREGKPTGPTEEEIRRFISFVEGIIFHGLGFDKKLVDALDFAELEKAGAYPIPPKEENDRLLKAVAGAVAEAGPWNASMEMVARRSGLSKSGLYAHFKNKADMLGQMFITEIGRIVDYAELERSRSAVVEEQLYLVIAAIANYLRSRPEILITMDWLKTRRLELGEPVPLRIYRIFGGINLKAAVKLPEGAELMDETLAQWIMFLVINTLMRRPAGTSFSDVSNKSFRILYKFVALGIDGW
jgi:AcrR family transcriptional regulator